MFWNAPQGSRDCDADLNRRGLLPAADRHAGLVGGDRVRLVLRWRAAVAVEPGSLRFGFSIFSI